MQRVNPAKLWKRSGGKWKRNQTFQTASWNANLPRIVTGFTLALFWQSFSRHSASGSGVEPRPARARALHRRPRLARTRNRRQFAARSRRTQSRLHCLQEVNPLQQFKTKNKLSQVPQRLKLVARRLRLRPRPRPRPRPHPRRQVPPLLQLAPFRLGKVARENWPSRRNI